MKTIMVTTLLLLSSMASARSIHECQSTRDVGAAYVNQRGFAQEMRQLRRTCAAWQSRAEAAEIVWVQYDRAYVCRVGYFCNSGGN